MNTARPETETSITDDIVDALLVGWSGLRHYLRQRRAGAPANATMDTLLGELLRLKLHDSTDIQGVLRHLTASNR